MFRAQIDPARLSSRKAKLLAAVLASNKDKRIIDAVDPATGKPVVYRVPAPTKKNPQAMRDVVLRKRLVAYQRNKHPAETRYAVCDVKPLGYEGSEAGIFFSSTTIKTNITGNGEVGIVSKNKQMDKQRCVKLSKDPEAAERECCFLRLISLFHAKQVVIDGERAATVMRRIEGKSLIDYLIADYYKTVFNVDQRLELTILVGEAIMGQPHAHGIIHRDIKGDNVMLVVDKHNNPKSVVIVDYDLAKFKNEQVYEKVGTIHPIDYRAPEVKQNTSSDEKSDAYSFATFLNKIVWQCLFHDEKYNDLSQSQKVRIAAIMQRGINEKSQHRASVAEIVEEFKAVRDERQSVLRLNVKLA